MSVRLYVGNLPEELSRQELEAVFSDSETLSTKIITDRKTNKCRGFGFVTVKTEELADAFIEKFNGASIKEATLKIERAQPRAKDKEDAPEAPTNSGGARRKSGGNAGSGNKSRKSSGSTADSDSFQPDPRWASELEKLKQMLAATNS